MNFYNFNYQDLEKLLLENNFKKYNTIQLLDFIYKKKIVDTDKMSNISNTLKKFVNETFNFSLPLIIKKQESKSTIKYLLELKDSETIECVLMKQDYGNSLCISSQIGCNMNCSFCASGKLKKVRNLEVNELVGQVLAVEQEEKIIINNVVIMGIGEPFDNYNNIIKFLDILVSDKMMNKASRKVTVSTCGIVPKIIEFANLKSQVNLAVSLHASNDIIRSNLMKINNAYSIKELINAIDYYIKTTNRKVTIEYILIKDVNDSEKDALNLVKLLKGKLVYVNLIPYNENKLSKYKRSINFKINLFYDILKKNRVDVIIRKEFGKNIDAACGQLKSNYKEE